MTDSWYIRPVALKVLFLLSYHSFAVPELPELQKTKGQIVIVSLQAPQLRIPFSGKYCSSKHALVRFAGFITIGKPLTDHMVTYTLALNNTGLHL